MNSHLAKNICLATNQGEKHFFTLASLGRKSVFLPDLWQEIYFYSMKIGDRKFCEIEKQNLRPAVSVANKGRKFGFNFAKFSVPDFHAVYCFTSCFATFSPDLYRKTWCKTKFLEFGLNDDMSDHYKTAIKDMITIFVHRSCTVGMKCWLNHIAALDYKIICLFVQSWLARHVHLSCCFCELRIFSL